VIHSNKGISPSEFVLSHTTRYTIDVNVYRYTSRIVRGIDLTGLFNAKFIPEGWILSDTEYGNFCTFYNSLLSSIHQPKSLFEIAARIVNIKLQVGSRKQKRSIPLQIRQLIKHIVAD
jgi:hypothetical protein